MADAAALTTPDSARLGLIHLTRAMATLRLIEDQIGGTGPYDPTQDEYPIYAATRQFVDSVSSCLTYTMAIESLINAHDIESVSNSHQVFGRQSSFTEKALVTRALHDERPLDTALRQLVMDVENLVEAHTTGTATQRMSRKGYCFLAGAALSVTVALAIVEPSPAGEVAALGLAAGIAADCA